MTKEYLTSELKKLSDKYEIDKKVLYREFAFSNNPYKEGDIISDNTTTIKIEIIKWSYNYDGASYCVYHGTQLNKDGTVSKKQNDTTIYKSNIIIK